MGFVNINGYKIHTSSLSFSSGTTGHTITTTGAYFQSPKTTYHLLGEDIIVSDPPNLNVGMTIATINCIGWKYFEELKKQGIQYGDELMEILEQRYKIYCRDRKINNILETNS